MTGFLVIAALLTVTPGPDMALITRQVLALGRSGAFATTLGIATGCLSHAAASAFGLSVILARSATAYDVLRSLGAAYLVFLGIQALRGSGPAAGMQGTAPDASRTAPPTSWRRPFVQGLLTNLLNPKVALFYLTFLPQFVSPAGPVLAQFLLLAGIHVAMGILWLSVYAVLLDRLAAVLGSGPIRRRIEAVTGAMLVFLGLRLALENAKR